MKKKYNLKQDHIKIKAQIKKREKRIDELIKNEDCNRYISEELEDISQEMYAINF